MGRKLKETTPPSEPESPNDPEIKAEKKKKKKKNRDPDSTQQSPKRKLEETDTQTSPESNERKKKKNKKEKENKEVGSEENGKRSETHEDGHVAVTGKEAMEAKYAPLKSFAESNLPSEVLQCCRNFDSPSPIQSRAWPFLLDGRDFIGIAATGSGEFSLDFASCLCCLLR